MRFNSAFKLRHSAIGLLGSIVLLLLWRVDGLAQPELVDRIVAIIGRDVVTLSEAEQAAALLELRGVESASLADVVERLIEARLIEREVLRFTDDSLSDDDVAEAVAAVRAEFPSEEVFSAMLARRGVSEEDLDAELRRQLRVNRYLERRFRALTYVSQEEIELFFDAEIVPRLPSPREPTNDEADQVRQVLEERKFNERVDQWLEELKDRSRIRRYVW